MTTRTKVYLGDGLYADHDGYQLCLTAENGMDVSDTVYLDSEVWAALVRYVKRIHDAQEAQQ